MTVNVLNCYVEPLYMYVYQGHSAGCNFFPWNFSHWVNPLPDTICGSVTKTGKHGFVHDNFYIWWSLYFMLQNLFWSVKNLTVCWFYFALDNPGDWPFYYNILCTHLTTFLNTTKRDNKIMMCSGVSILMDFEVFKYRVLFDRSSQWKIFSFLIMLNNYDLVSLFVLIPVTLATSQMKCLVRCVCPSLLLTLYQLSVQRGKPINTLVGKRI